MTNTRRQFAAIILAVLSVTAIPAAASAQTVLITGANSGIGLEFAKQYAARGWNLILTHRRPELPKTLADLTAKYKNQVRIEKVDVTSEEQVRALAKRLENVPVDIMINNAGVYNDRGTCAAEDDACAGDWTTQNFGRMRYQLLDTILSVNVKGPLLVTETLYNNVKASKLKKIVAVSSSNGSLTGPQGGGGAIFYRSSKAALNRAMQLVAESVRRDGVTVVMLNPGPTLTEHQMYLKGQFNGMLETSFTVGNMIKTIDGVTIKDTGRFLRYDGVAEAW
ncbi:MAG TPA: SDR family NAD(P)-dependent oxidoreductase [Vicinamibacterales bacterium]|nr:SDR family NAD(P)-dependent oxidoreductase [Vicinamibacterales bacterium]